MDDVIRALCKTITDYHELHSKCWGANSDECKELMTMQFPVIQGMTMQNIIKRIGAMPYDNKLVADELRAYETTHNSG